VAKNVSKTQIDRLGDRLRQALTVEDIKMLDEHQRSYSEAYEHVVRVIRDQLGLAPTGRHPKTTRSIVEKLRRESIRLSQIQDIAGCRVVVAGLIEQDRVIASLRSAFPGASIIDRRNAPSHGYRAVHVVVSVLDRLVEVQVRSRLQHLWAELSEKCSDVFDDASIKYGGGRENVRGMLDGVSQLVLEYEAEERSQTSTRQTRDALAERILKMTRNLKAPGGA
jgi:ppGpp synthetase/RelA/SpoT-type nucleotidyltranferase